MTVGQPVVGTVDGGKIAQIVYVQVRKLIALAVKKLYARIVVQRQRFDPVRRDSIFGSRESNWLLEQFSF